MEWRIIPDFLDYEVSSNGHVRRIGWFFSPKHQYRNKKLPYFLPQFTDGKGYSSVSLMRGKIGHKRRVHTLVLAAFIGPLPKGFESCHNDGIKTHNSLSNLRYDTHSSNQLDRARHGTSNRKLSADKVQEIISNREFGHSVDDLSCLYGLSRTTIYKVIRGNYPANP